MTIVIREAGDRGRDKNVLRTLTAESWIDCGMFEDKGFFLACWFILYEISGTYSED